MYWIIMFILFAAFALLFQDAEASTFDTVTAYSDLWAHPVVIMVALVLLVVVSHVAALWWASGTIKEPTYKIRPKHMWDHGGVWELQKRGRFGFWWVIYRDTDKRELLNRIEHLQKQTELFTRQGIPYKKIP